MAAAAKEVEGEESCDRRIQEHIGILSVNLHQCCEPAILVQAEHHLFRTIEGSDKWDTVAYKASIELVGNTMIVLPNEPIRGGSVIAKIAIAARVDDDPYKVDTYDSMYEVVNSDLLHEHAESISHAINPSAVARDGCTILDVPGDWDKFPPTGAGNALSDAVIERLKVATQCDCMRMLFSMLYGDVQMDAMGHAE